MKCPQCGHQKSTVINTDRYERCILRVRRCFSCRCIWMTGEEIASIMQPGEETVTVCQRLLAEVKLEVAGGHS